MSKPREVAGGMADRLKAAAVEVADADDALTLARARRNELIVQAVDEGMTQSAVARLAGLKAPSLIPILAAAYAEPVLP